MRIYHLLALLLGAATASGARATDASPAVEVAAAVAAARENGATLFVELVLNGQQGGAITKVRRIGEHLWVEARALREAGIQLADQGEIDLAARAGFRTTYDAEGQRLILDVDPSLLPVARIAGDRPGYVATTVDTGALLNYDLYVQRGGRTTVASLWTEQRVFGSIGALSNTGILRAGGSGAKGYVRYDTTFRRIDERHALTITAGDLITQALPWTTAVRVGGFQVARSFRTRPDLITAPLPSFAGQAAVPSGVDLFIDGYRQQHADIAPGRFVLDNIPVVNGAGEARIVTTDALGRQIATTIPFYVTPDLLRPGLTDFAAEIGALRRGYGVRNFGYGRALASASVRHGVATTLTVEGHAEGARGLVSGGVGAVWAPGRWGALHGSVATSRRDGWSGTRVTAGYTYTSRRFSIGAERSVRSRGFADLGSFDLAEWRGSTRSTRVSGSMAIDGFGSVGVGYVDARTRDGTRARIASGSASIPIGKVVSAFAAVDYDFGRRAASAQLRVVIPFGRDSASVGVGTQPGRGILTQANLSRSVPTEGGLGAVVDAAIDQRGRVYGQANGIYRADWGQVTAGASRAPGASSAWGGVSGSVVALDGQVFVTNQIPDSFAVVSTGHARVPVYYENQLIGRTGKTGRVFIPRVVAYHPSRFTVDAVNLPADTQASVIETRVALREGTGAVIRMPVAVVRSATASLVDASGQPVPAGALATLPNGERAMVGWDGIVLITGATGAVPLTVESGGKTCRATVTIPANAGPVANLGTALCA